MCTVFLPLRSNSAWFASELHWAELDRRLKNLVLTHDTVTFQNGRYRLVVTEASSIDYYIPPSAIDRRHELRFISPGTPVLAQVSASGTGNWHPIVHGPALVNYEVDFFPLVHKAGLADASYLKWADIDISSSAKSGAQQMAESDLRTDGELGFLPHGNFLRKAIVSGLYVDSFLAAALGLPLSIDYQAAPIITRGNSALAQRFFPELRSFCQNTWVNLGIPDAGELSWKEIDRARESAAGREYRELITRITRDAVSGLATGVNLVDIEREFQRALVAELVSELLQRRESLGKVVVSIGLNFIPYGGAVSAASEVLSLIKEKRSWVSLLESGRSRETLQT